jgi:hypothetical protein
MNELLITAALICAGVLYYKFVFVPDHQIKNELKQADPPKDTNDAQGDDYCLIASAIGKCRTEQQFEKCLKSMKIFQEKYGNTFTGQQDVSILLGLYEKRQERVMLVC